MNIKDKIYSNISYNTNELITKIDLALIAAGVWQHYYLMTLLLNI